MFKRALYRWLLPRFISKTCEASIPRSGKEGEAVNCYVVRLDQNGGPYFVATGIEGDVLSGLKYNGESFSDSAEISISDLENGSLNVTHYYGLSEVNYDNIYDVAWHYVTKIVYININFRKFIEKSLQYFFNKRKLVTKRRMDLLRFMMEDQINRTNDGIDSLSLMTKIHSLRLFLHPSWELQLKKMEIYLDSLVESGELKQINNEYVVTGKAISTIEKYEEEERRHTEAVKLQRKMLYITIVAVIFAIVQTGLVKLPTILDFSKLSTERSSHNITLHSDG